MIGIWIFKCEILTLELGIWNSEFEFLNLKFRMLIFKNILFGNYKLLTSNFGSVYELNI